MNSANLALEKLQSHHVYLDLSLFSTLTFLVHFSQKNLPPPSYHILSVIPPVLNACRLLSLM